jgi:hypothetical protein
MTYSAELRQRLDAGIRELEGDIARLRAAVAALDGAAPSPSATPDTDGHHHRPRRRRRRSGASAARVREVVPAGKLESLLSRSDGLSTSELAKRTNGDQEQVLILLKELEQRGRAHRSGARRSTRWHSGGSKAVAAP